MPSPQTSRPVRLLASAVAALLLTVAAASCSSGSSEGTGAGNEAATSTAATAAGDPTTSSLDGSSSGGTGTDGTAGASDLDLCAEVTAEDVGAILTDADLSAAQPNPALDAPTCQYLVDWAGTPLSVLQITWNEDGYLDALRESNPTATDLAGVGDGVAISDTSIVVAGASGDFQIDAGVELSEGGTVATQEQLVAVANLVEGR